MNSTRLWEIGPEREPEFRARGVRSRHFFPHRLCYLPKCGPDALKIATWMRQAPELSGCFELVLYAHESMLGEFPQDLFFDDEVVWHQQHLGRPGQVATANLLLQDAELTSMVHLSDLVQRIGRRRELKTRVEKRFKGWVHMLLNGVLDFALRNGAKRIRTPRAELARAATDPARNPRPELFERIYDATVHQLWPVRAEGGWWVVDVRAVRDLWVAPRPRTEALPAGRRVCLCHDLERDLGHPDGEPAFRAAARDGGPRRLEGMLAAEAAAGVRATYHVLGTIFEEVRDRISEASHCLAFHSYDHGPAGGQLDRCRELDYRVKGYRPARSVITPELAPENLCWQNFEWLASGVPSLGIEQPVQERLVKIPILVDDFELHRSRLPYQRWEEAALGTLKSHAVATLCLHDCYADHWLAHYPRLLERLQSLGELVTMDHLAAEVTLRAAV